jgi:regulator of sigma D
MDDSRSSDPVRDLEARRREAARAVEEAGGGESEGFELAEQELIDHASHGDEHTTGRIMHDAAAEGESATEPAEQVYGEADEEHKPD